MYGEVSGRSKLEGRANATADALAGELRIAFQDWGWMSSTEGGMNYVERSASFHGRSCAVKPIRNDSSGLILLQRIDGGPLLLDPVVASLRELQQGSCSTPA
jgi:hypothetical protein